MCYSLACRRALHVGESEVALRSQPGLTRADSPALLFLPGPARRTWLPRRDVLARELLEEPHHRANALVEVLEVQTFVRAVGVRVRQRPSSEDRKSVV